MFTLIQNKTLRLIYTPIESESQKEYEQKKFVFDYVYNLMCR